MSECTHDCSSWGADCSSRDLKAPANAKSKVKKVIAVVSGKGDDLFDLGFCVEIGRAHV